MDGYRNVYFDEILNNWLFRRAVKKYIRDQEFEKDQEVMIVNGYINNNGFADLLCSVKSEENMKVLVVENTSGNCKVRS